MMSSCLEVKVTLNIDPYWPEGLSLEKAEEEMKAMGLPLNRRSLSAIRKGTEKGDWATPYKIAQYLSLKTGQEIKAHDLFKVEQ